MGSDTKPVGQLTDEERTRLCEIVEWYECPLCNGESVNFDAGKFCVACTNTGKLLSPAANIVNGMKNLGYFSDADEITALRERVAAVCAEAQSTLSDNEALRATIATLEAGLADARAYVEEAVEANGGIDGCEIHMRHDLEAIDALLANRAGIVKIPPAL